eukprot:CAMPEP_0116894076 /NCGR_PEP_ID=MMETSP0467-20121206/3938_1 /TAXON_ID=283647 /ORGANISM="Mesodinium pulex, Strain SPMC105" /LENGTH=130 /DNA_ID=CAMNT_0004564121 /DNA_START=122 /DNA_END=514 /DNA_ORIENTATION=-
MQYLVAIGFLSGLDGQDVSPSIEWCVNWAFPEVITPIISIVKMIESWDKSDLPQLVADLKVVLNNILPVIKQCEVKAPEFTQLYTSIQLLIHNLEDQNLYPKFFENAVINLKTLKADVEKFKKGKAYNNH